MYEDINNRAINKKQKTLNLQVNTFQRRCGRQAAHNRQEAEKTPNFCGPARNLATSVEPRRAHDWQRVRLTKYRSSTFKLTKAAKLHDLVFSKEECRQHSARSQLMLLSSHRKHVSVTPSHQELMSPIYLTSTGAP